MTARSARGRFIVIEGIDGAGTTTQTHSLGQALREAGFEAVITCEPSEGPVGALIRRILKEPAADERALRWSAMALLFAADRVDHLDSVVLPALERGAFVVSDRYDLSSIAYQSVTSPGGDRIVPWIRELNAEALRPDLTIVLGLSPETAERRRRARGGAEELFEERSLQERLAATYSRAEELMPGDRIVHVSSEGPAESVAAAIWKVVAETFRLAASPS